MLKYTCKRQFRKYRPADRKFEDFQSTLYRGTWSLQCHKRLEQVAQGWRYLSKKVHQNQRHVPKPEKNYIFSIQLYDKFYEAQVLNLIHTLLKPARLTDCLTKSKLASVAFSYCAARGPHAITGWRGKLDCAPETAKILSKPEVSLFNKQAAWSFVGVR